MKTKTTMKKMIWLIVAIAASFTLFTLPTFAANKPPVPTAKYTSKVSNTVQKLALSVPSTSAGTPSIYYTTNGDTPEIDGDTTKLYTGKIKIKNNMTVKYRSFLNGEKSAVGKVDFIYLKPVIIKEIYCTDGKTTKITMKWKRNYSADGYYVYRQKKGSSSWKKMTTVKDASKNKYVDSSVTKNATYNYYVVSYKGGVKSLYEDVIQTIKAKHSHVYELKSVNCTAGIRTYACKFCSATTTETFPKNTHEMTKSLSGYCTVETCKWCGKHVEYLNEDIPSYWNSNIINALDTAKDRGELPGYVFMTDPHWEKNAKHSPEIVSYVTKQMGYPYAVCGGDVIATYHTTRDAAIEEIESFYEHFTVPVLSIAGNHDYNSNANYDTSSFLSASDVESLIYSHNPSNTHMEYNGDFSYTDDDANKVRYITFYYDETAPVPTEITDCIRNKVCELDSDWDVILFSHAYWNYKKPGIENVPKDIGIDLANRLLAIQRDSNATIALWHVGHIHRDKSETLTDEFGTQLLVVSSNCDTYKKSTTWGGLAMPGGTDEEQVVEIVQIDKNNQRIYMTRIGAGSSRTFDYSQQAPFEVQMAAAPAPMPVTPELMTESADDTEQADESETEPVAESVVEPAATESEQVAEPEPVGEQDNAEATVEAEPVAEVDEAEAETEAEPELESEPEPQMEANAEDATAGEADTDSSTEPEQELD